MTSDTLELYKNKVLANQILSEYPDLKTCCRAEQISLRNVRQLLQCSSSPINPRSGKLTKTAQRLTEIFAIDPIELFPPELYGNYSYDEVESSEPPNEPPVDKGGPAREMLLDLTPNETIKLLDQARLSFFEHEVIALRYGLDEASNYHCHTIEEIARSFRQSTEEIIAYEYSAAEKLNAVRNPN